MGQWATKRATPRQAPARLKQALWKRDGSLRCPLTVQGGLYEVVPGLYQVRTLDLSNITFAEGEDGVVLFDPPDLDRDGEGRARSLLRAPPPQADRGGHQLA